MKRETQLWGIESVFGGGLSEVNAEVEMKRVTGNSRRLHVHVCIQKDIHT